MPVIDPSLLLKFAAICLIIELTPGPNMAYLAILTSKEGRSAGFTALTGIATGLLAIGLVTAMGLAELISQSNLLYQGLRWVGVFYLLWLAWEGWHDTQDVSPEKQTHAFKSKFFWRGLITNLLNPKAFLFYVAVLPGFLTISAHLVPQAALLTLVYVLIASAIHTCIVMLADMSRKFFASRNPAHVRRTLSVLLGFVALWLAWKTR